jgi:AraC-like DNA-binding protein
MGCLAAQSKQRSDELYPRIRGRRLMLLAPHRSFYRGQLPEATNRSFGGFLVYVALDLPFLLKRGGGVWETCEMAIFAPNHAHSLRGRSGFIAQVLLEQEDIVHENLPRWMTSGNGAVYDPELIAHWRRVCDSVGCADESINVEQLVESLCGHTLLQRILDSRIAQVVHSIQTQSGAHHSAEDCANLVGLSLSRFLHLFRQEVGVSFRRFRAWKRARGLLARIAQGGNLTHLALDSGYADSSHFSHSIRGVYGVTPRELVAAARHMPTVTSANHAAAAL